MADSSDPTFSLLALYEFEAKLHLGHPDLEGVLERVSSVSLTEPKTFETVAGRVGLIIIQLTSMPSTDPPDLLHTHTHTHTLALSIQVPARGHTLGVRALKMAIQYHLRASQLDCDRLR